MEGHVSSWPYPTDATERVPPWPISIASLELGTRYVYWQDERMWLGYVEDFPDYMTRGATLEELQENLKDICDDLTGGNIPGVRHVAELQLA